MDFKTRSIRVPHDLDSAILELAESRGSNYNDTALSLIRRGLGLPQPPTEDFIDDVLKRLNAEYPTGTSYPEDVTLRMFRIIATDNDLAAAYAHVTTTNGTPDRAKSDTLHRRIGKAVKNALGATPHGRRKADPDDLIDTFTLLVPDHG